MRWLGNSSLRFIATVIASYGCKDAELSNATPTDNYCNASERNQHEYLSVYSEHDPGL